MARFELRFFCFYGSNDYIKCNYKKQVDQEFNEQWIDLIINRDGKNTTISLDKSTAIKFAKTLRTEINKITESEVNNG